MQQTANPDNTSGSQPITPPPAPANDVAQAALPITPSAPRELPPSETLPRLAKPKSQLFAGRLWRNTSNWLLFLLSLLVCAAILFSAKWWQRSSDSTQQMREQVEQLQQKVQQLKTQIEQPAPAAQ